MSRRCLCREETAASKFACSAVQAFQPVLDHGCCYAKQSNINLVLPAAGMTHLSKSEGSVRSVNWRTTALSVTDAGTTRIEASGRSRVAFASHPAEQRTPSSRRDQASRIMHQICLPCSYCPAQYAAASSAATWCCQPGHGQIGKRRVLGLGAFCPSSLIQLRRCRRATLQESSGGHRRVSANHSIRMWCNSLFELLQCCRRLGCHRL